MLTDEDQRRLQRLGENGDTIDPTVWGTWTSSVKNHRATAEEVLGGMRGELTYPGLAQDELFAGAGVK